MLNRIFDLDKINRKISNFDAQLKKTYFNYLINEFGVLNTFHSNRIEGTNLTLTLNDTKQIINNTYNFKSVIDVNKEREIKDTINHQEAFKYIFDIIDANKDIITIIKELHKIIGNGVIEDAGNYKRHENYLINSSGKEINFTSPLLVNEKMEELKKQYNTIWQDLTAFERAVKIHMAIINIHPFSDGNGRVARLIMNYELIKQSYPPVVINESQKLSYYAVIEEINIHTDYVNNPLIIGDTKLFIETIEQLSILTFKNMQTYFE